MLSGLQIAVPTSVGYGAALGGISPLLSALTAGAPGVATVNIDNGFGGGCLGANMYAEGVSYRLDAKLPAAPASQLDLQRCSASGFAFANLVCACCFAR